MGKIHNYLELYIVYPFSFFPFYVSLWFDSDFLKWKMRTKLIFGPNGEIWAQEFVIVLKLCWVGWRWSPFMNVCTLYWIGNQNSTFMIASHPPFPHHNGINKFKLGSLFPFPFLLLQHPHLTLKPLQNSYGIDWGVVFCNYFP